MQKYQTLTYLYLQSLYLHSHIMILEGSKVKIIKCFRTTNKRILNCKSETDFKEKSDILRNKRMLLKILRSFFKLTLLLEAALFLDLLKLWVKFSWSFALLLFLLILSLLISDEDRLTLFIESWVLSFSTIVRFAFPKQAIYFWILGIYRFWGNQEMQRVWAEVNTILIIFLFYY